MQGGMYNILKFVYELQKENITSKRLSELTGLSKEACSNNLNRLVHAGLMERNETISNTKGRQVHYKIKNDVIDFIIKHLY
jgi:predicted transcriptional regulator